MEQCFQNSYKKWLQPRTLYQAPPSTATDTRVIPNEMAQADGPAVKITVNIDFREMKYLAEVHPVK